MSSHFGIEAGRLTARVPTRGFIDMGRMLDALKRADGSHSEIDAPMSSRQEAAAEEIPFIEVGPRKSMEASPSVLAVLPAVAPSARKESAALASGAKRNEDWVSQMREMLLKALDTLPIADRLAFCQQALRSLGDSIKSGPQS